MAANAAGARDRAHVESMRRWRRAGIIRQRDSFVRPPEPGNRARLSNTVVLTTIATGIKVNVIPAEATATLDFRLLPDVDVDAFLAELGTVIKDDRGGARGTDRYTAPSRRWRTSSCAVHAVVRSMAEGARVVPDYERVHGFSPLSAARRAGLWVRAMPGAGRKSLGGIHGHNERISVENLRLGMQVLYEVVRRLCAVGGDSSCDTATPAARGGRDSKPARP